MENNKEVHSPEWWNTRREAEQYGWDNPVLSRKEVYELFREIFKEGKLSWDGRFNISAANEIRKFQEQLRWMTYTKAIIMDIGTNKKEENAAHWDDYAGTWLNNRPLDAPYIMQTNEEGMRILQGIKVQKREPGELNAVYHPEQPIQYPDRALEIGVKIAEEYIDRIYQQELHKQDSDNPLKTLQRDMERSKTVYEQWVEELLLKLPEELQVEIATRILDKAVTNKQQEEHGKGE